MTTGTEEATDSAPRSRRLVLAWVALALAVVVVGSFAATRTELFDVDEIRLIGVSPTLGEAAVLDALSIRMGAPMTGIDLDEATRRVRTMLEQSDSGDTHQTEDSLLQLAKKKRVNARISMGFCGKDGGNKDVYEGRFIIGEKPAETLKFKCGKELGSGAYGTVYEATPLSDAFTEAFPDSATVALKVMSAKIMLAKYDFQSEVKFQKMLTILFLLLK